MLQIINISVISYSFVIIGTKPFEKCHIFFTHAQLFQIGIQCNAKIHNMFAYLFIIINIAEHVLKIAYTNKV